MGVIDDSEIEQSICSRQRIYPTRPSQRHPLEVAVRARFCEDWKFRSGRNWRHEKLFPKATTLGSTGRTAISASARQIYRQNISALSSAQSAFVSDWLPSRIWEKSNAAALRVKRTSASGASILGKVERSCTVILKCPVAKKYQLSAIRHRKTRAQSCR